MRFKSAAYHNVPLSSSVQPLRVAGALLLVLVACFALGCSEYLLVPQQDESTTLAHQVGDGTVEILFGPHEFVRGKGKPVTETVRLVGPDHEKDLTVYNHLDLRVVNGDEHGNDRVSSAVIEIDGQEIFGPSDFSQQVAELITEVLVNESSELSVTLKGAPGSYVTVTLEGEVTNRAPIVNAGPDLTVSVGVVVAVDGGTWSDPDGDDLQLPRWSFISKPEGSTASFTGSLAAVPVFIPDKPGVYHMALSVSDGIAEGRDELIITAVDNTSRATMGPGGGVLFSKDGNASIDVPAGAVNEEVEITITKVEPDQFPEWLESAPLLSDVYDFGPDGMQFTQPVQVTITILDPGSIVDGVLEASIPVLTRASNSIDGPKYVPLEATLWRRYFFDATVGEATGDYSQWIRESEDSPEPSKQAVVDAFVQELVFGDLHSEVNASYKALLSTPPDEVSSTDPFEAFTELLFEPEVATDLQGTNITAAAEDASENLSLSAPLGPYTLVGTRLRVSAEYRCDTEGAATLKYSSGIDFDVPSDRFANPEVFSSVGPFTITMAVEQLLACQRDGGPTDLQLEALGAEGISIHTPIYALGDKLSVTVDGGAKIFDRHGTVALEATGIPLSAISYSTVGISHSLLEDKLNVISSIGVFTGSVDLNAAAVELEKADWSVAGVTDNNGNTTDAIAVGSDPENQQLVFTQHEDRNVLFVEATVDGLAPVASLATAFYDNGTSVFGDDRPISVFVGPSGFTENDPMLAVTIADDGSGAGEVLKLDLVNGLVVSSVVTEVFVNGEPRRIRCLDVNGTYFCAASSFGTEFGGFGGVTFFTWDGQDGFNFIINRITSAVGIDLIRDGDRVLVTSTDFHEDTYAIDELTTDGSYVGFEIFDVSANCQGPGHAIFRSTTEVILSCKTNGMVISDVFDDGN